jgi:dCMP deaminase
MSEIDIIGLPTEKYLIYMWDKIKGNHRDQSWWDNYFLGLAEQISKMSRDPSTQVGAIIIDENRRIISTGYNGFPRGIKDDDRLNNRELKYKIVIHAEVNAILFANRDLHNCVLYTYPFMPCSSVGNNCASVVIQSGIKRVVTPFSDNPRWNEGFKMTRELFKEAGVELNEIHDLG